MPPRTDQHLPRRGQSLECSQLLGRVPVRPALDQQHRALHAIITRRQALIAPIRPVQRVADIAKAPRCALLQPLSPDRGEALADQRRIGRREIQRIHHRRIAFEHPRPDAAARVGEARIYIIIGGTHHDRLQRRRALHRHLPLHHRAIRFADHADGAGAPGLRGDPGDHVVAVLPLLRRVDVGGETRRTAGAAHIVLHHDIAALREVRHHRRIFVTIVGQRSGRGGDTDDIPSPREIARARPAG